ncbi:cytochrome P450 [Rhizoctonia solani]|uniref:Cytochrome P450 n=1 Tax=Rhizoctonia solani TaxID=456999 RepID=A0A8H7I5A2_9AGAM|nr:cytochrome P450 [Rhizoctonia solani]
MAFMTLGKQLNTDVFLLKAFGQSTLVLNSAQAASELLDKRSAKYSDRNIGPMLSDPRLMDWSAGAATARYGDLWRHYRRMLNNWLNAREVVQFRNLQQHQARYYFDVCLNSRSTPSHFINAMASTMFRLAYGYHLQGHDDLWFQRARLAVYHASKAPLMTNFIVNVAPILAHIPDWFPGASWKRVAKEWRTNKQKALDEPYEWAKSQVATGVAGHSILSVLLQDHKLVSDLSTQERDKRLKELAFVIYAGGTDTSASLLVSFVAAMVQNPSAQLQAQKELDHVLGPVTLPTVTDKERLPYVRNLIQEVMRLYPVLPSGFPHACFEDDTYRGCNVLKGTNVAMSRDEAYYPDPEVFDPNRYLDQRFHKYPGLDGEGANARDLFCRQLGIHLNCITAISFHLLKEAERRWHQIEPSIEQKSNSLVLWIRIQVNNLPYMNFTGNGAGAQSALAPSFPFHPHHIHREPTITRSTIHSCFPVFSVSPAHPHLCLQTTGFGRPPSSLGGAAPVAPGSAFRLSGPHPASPAGPGRSVLLTILVYLPSHLAVPAKAK